jgi:hypothetical protein
VNLNGTHRKSCKAVRAGKILSSVKFNLTAYTLKHEAIPLPCILPFYSHAGASFFHGYGYGDTVWKLSGMQP